MIFAGKFVDHPAKKKSDGNDFKRWTGCWQVAACVWIASFNRTQNLDIGASLEAEFPQRPLTSIFGKRLCLRGRLRTWRPGEDNERWRGSSKCSATRPDSTSRSIEVDGGNNNLLLLLHSFNRCRCSGFSLESWTEACLLLSFHNDISSSSQTSPCKPQASTTLIPLSRQKCWTSVLPRNFTAQCDWYNLK